MKYSLILITICMFFSLTSCGTDCGSWTNYHYEAKVGALDEKRTPGEPNKLIEIPEDSAVSINKFVLDVIAINSTIRRFSLSLSLFNSAHACSVIFPWNEEFRHFKITSNHDFSDQFPAGSNLIELFLVELYKTEDSEHYDNYHQFEILELLDNGIFGFEHIQLSLKEAPTKSKVHSFTIEIGRDTSYTNEVLFE